MTSGARWTRERTALVVNLSDMMVYFATNMDRNQAVLVMEAALNALRSEMS